MEKIKQDNKNIVVKLAKGNLLNSPALNITLIILNVLYVAQELIYIMIMNTISRFKCNSKKCNHVHVILKKSVFSEPLAQEINSKFNFKRLRTNINIVIDTLYMYFSGSSSTRAISQYLLHRKILRFHMPLFINGLKILAHYSKKSLKIICLKILTLLISGMLMKL